MTHRKATTSLAALALVLLGQSPAVLAQAVQSLYSPVIIVSASLSTKTDPDARPIQMREDGSGQARFVSKGSDLSYVGGAGARYFIGLEINSAVTLPDGTDYRDFVAWHENGDPSSKRVLTTDPSLYRGSVVWSADGRRVAFLGRRYGSDGGVLESGAFVGDVEWASGAPQRVINERFVATDRPGDRVAVNGVVLDADAERVAINMMRDVVDAQGRHVRYEAEGMYVATLPSMDGPYTPPLPALIRIALSTPDAERGITAFSPVPGDDRLLFIQRESPTNPYIHYFWTVEVPRQYDGSELTPTAVTTRSNSNANYLFSLSGWSPTGDFVVFTSSRSTMWTECHVYKIASNGKGKAIRLTNRADMYSGVLWRP